MQNSRAERSESYTIKVEDAGEVETHGPKDQRTSVREAEEKPNPLQHKWNWIPIILLANFTLIATFYLYIRLTTLTSKNLVHTILSYELRIVSEE
jgi:hypothetical protein